MALIASTSVLLISGCGFDPEGARQDDESRVYSLVAYGVVTAHHEHVADSIGRGDLERARGELRSSHRFVLDISAGVNVTPSTQALVENIQEQRRVLNSAISNSRSGRERAKASDLDSFRDLRDQSDQLLDQVTPVSLGDEDYGVEDVELNIRQTLRELKTKERSISNRP